MSSPLIPVSSFGSRLKLPGAVGFVRMIVKLVLPSPLVPLLLLASASTVMSPCWFVGLGNVKVNVPVTGSLVVITTGLKGCPLAWSSSTVAPGVVTPIRLGVAMFVYPGAPVTS